MPRYTNHHRGRSAAAGIRYDCSMLLHDETVFFLPPDHGRRFIGGDRIYGPSSVLSEDQTVILDLPELRISGGEGVPEEAIAKRVGARIHRRRRNADEDCGVCVVCQDSLGEGNGGIATLDCAHEFHAPCIGRWLRLKNTCPLCKATVVLASSLN